MKEGKLECKGLTKKYGKKEVLHNVKFLYAAERMMWNEKIQCFKKNMG